ncbi:MAG: SAM-dependent chlorinase/fluorinase [Nitrososphaerota archaeon]|nr:S-adenosyl-l-methionine hydroxide adenosyltransferase family protein [Candidatus Bathyarchaeota archaeon]MDW8193777.1 SAM-dependent chlorinase/fluorinase [Nitrososphaerota archaeon]
MSSQIITLTTDFGLADPYVAEMKAVILRINPNVTIVDITHQIEKFNIKMGAFILASAAPFFPEGTIHIAVVDPGVGTERKPILIEAESAFFIGPDNGLLTLAAKKQGIKHVYEISNPKFMLPKISTTFHGRDVFAPAAAYLSMGVPPSEFGLELHEISTPTFAGIIESGETLVGEVIHIDDFGNIITNFTDKELNKFIANGKIHVKLGETELSLNVRKTYAEVEPLKPLAIIGSHDFLEISINRANAAKFFNVKVGDKVTLYRFLQGSSTYRHRLFP